MTLREMRTKLRKLRAELDADGGAVAGLAEEIDQLTMDIEIKTVVDRLVTSPALREAARKIVDHFGDVEAEDFEKTRGENGTKLHQHIYKSLLVLAAWLKQSRVK